MRSMPHSKGRRRALLGLAAAGGTALLGAPSFAHAAGKWKVETLHGFGREDGTRAVGSVIFGPDGMLYGVHAMGGLHGLGTLYRWSPVDGSFTVLHHLDYATGEPAEPEAGLIIGHDGLMWGTSLFGGVQFGGTIYTLATDGTMAIRSEFANDIGMRMPHGALVEGKPGRFYGTTGESVFRFDGRPGGQLKELHRFVPKTDGSGSQAALVFGPDGKLYGCNMYNGPLNKGTLFRLNTDGSRFEMLKAFDGKWEGYDLRAPLLAASDGYLYGCATNGGVFERGVVFRLGTDGSYEVVHHFAGGDNDGAYPDGALVEGPDGALYGTTSQGGDAPQSFGTVFRMTKRGRLRLIHRFTDGGAAGEVPRGALCFGPDGSLYGTTQSGNRSIGALYRLTPPAA